MPSPLGEGQTVAPINRHNLGEVPDREAYLSEANGKGAHPTTQISSLRVCICIFSKITMLKSALHERA